MADTTRSGSPDEHITQAVGMVCAQADCDIIEASDKLRNRAAALGQTIEMTAVDVLDGVVCFDL